MPGMHPSWFLSGELKQMLKRYKKEINPLTEPLKGIIEVSSEYMRRKNFFRGQVLNIYPDNFYINKRLTIACKHIDRSVY